jgi:DNA-directed RNA polymerase specialized sigma24 family protein
MAEAEIEVAVDVEQAVRSLPRAHLLLLRAALIGFNDQELAVLVGVPPESVRPLLRIAAAKLGSSLAELDGRS